MAPSFGKATLDGTKRRPKGRPESELETLLSEYVTKKVQKHMKDYEKTVFNDPLSMHSRVALVDRGYHTVQQSENSTLMGQMQ